MDRPHSPTVQMPLKRDLGRKKLDVQDSVWNWLQTRPPNFYEEGIKKLPASCEKCVIIEKAIQKNVVLLYSVEET